MHSVSKKKIDPVAPKKATIRLFDDQSRIKLPLPQNPVHRLHALLESEFSGGPARPVAAGKGLPLRFAGFRLRRD